MAATEVRKPAQTLLSFASRIEFACVLVELTYTCSWTRAQPVQHLIQPDVHGLMQWIQLQGHRFAETNQILRAEVSENYRCVCK